MRWTRTRSAMGMMVLENLVIREAYVSDIQDEEQCVVCLSVQLDRIEKPFFLLFFVSTVPSLFSSCVSRWCVTPRKDQGLHGTALVFVL